MLSKKLGISMIPADYINCIEMAYVSDEEFNEKFPLRAKRDEHEGNDDFYKKFTAEEIVDMYVKQARTAWKGIQWFIEYALSEKQDYIIEGYQIPPEEVAKMKDANIKVIYLYKENTEEILKGIKMGNPEEDWSLQHTKDEETLPRIAQMVSVFGKRVREESEKYKLSAFNTEMNFKEQITNILEGLMK